jgi:regulator of cell morphogenesis and NO signaling
MNITERTTITELTAQPVAGGRDWMREPLSSLIDHIVTTHHDVLREELPRLERMAAKAVKIHGSREPYLKDVADVVGELSADLNDHMRKEELVLFPAIRAIERGHACPAGWIVAPMTAMEQEHDRAGELLAELRGLTSAYEAPGWACETVRALYRGLEDLEAGMHVHVDLENTVLFPRALRAAGVTDEEYVA